MKLMVTIPEVAEDLAGIIFDARIPPLPDIFANQFSKHHETGASQERHLTFKEARLVITLRGHTPQHAHQLVLLAKKTAFEVLCEYGAKRLGIENYCPVGTDDVRHSDNTYLGLAWLDSQPNLQGTQEFIQQARAKFIKSLESAMNAAASQPKPMLQ